MEGRGSKRFTAAIEQARKEQKSLELILQVENNREEVAGQLERIGKISHYYKYVPFLSLVCDADYADILRKASSRDISDNIFDKPFRKILPGIASVELSNKLSIPKLERKIVQKTGKWNLEAIGAYDAQGYAEGEGIKVAVIDSGVDYTHSQLVQRFGAEKGYDFVNDTDEPMDENGHGTHVAGIIASRLCGVATSSTLYSVRILDEEGSGNEANLISGLEWCITNGIDIANMSLGSEEASTALEQVCQYAVKNGLILVAAAGNEGYGANYPAAFEGVISVAALDENLEHPEFSNIWETNAISAPGVNIASTYPGERYAMLSGTSMASPHVTGSLALILSMGKSPDEVEELMEKQADRLGKREIFGAGLIRVDKMAAVASMRANKGYVSKLVSSYLELERGIAAGAVMEVRRWLT